MKSEASPRKVHLYSSPPENVRYLTSQPGRNQEVNVDVPGHSLYQHIICNSTRVYKSSIGPQELCIRNKAQLPHKELWLQLAKTWAFLIWISRAVISKLGLANRLCSPSIFSVWCIGRKHSTICSITGHRKIIDGSEHLVNIFFHQEILSAATVSSEPSRNSWIRSCFREGSLEHLFLTMQM